MKAIDRLHEYLELKGIKPTRFEKEVGLSNGYLGTQKKRQADLGESILNQVIDYCLDINPVWLLSGRGEMLNNKETAINNIETRPRIPLNVAAGALSVCQDGITLAQCDQVPVISAFTHYDFTICVSGDSMEPEYKSGDELACLYIKNTSFVQWGRAHVLDTVQGIIVKRVYDDDEYILCESENSRFKDFRVHKSEVYNIALVIGLLRRY